MRRGGAEAALNAEERKADGGAGHTSCVGSVRGVGRIHRPGIDVDNLTVDLAGAWLSLAARPYACGLSRDPGARPLPSDAERLGMSPAAAAGRHRPAARADVAVDRGVRRQDAPGARGLLLPVNRRAGRRRG